MNTKNSVGTVFFVLSGIYYLFLSIISHMPGKYIQTVHIWDKAAHFSVYMILGILLCLGFKKTINSANKAILLSSIIVLVLGTLDEFHQQFVIERYSSIFDIIADVLGGFIGAVIIAYLPVLFKQKTTKVMVDK